MYEIQGWSVEMAKVKFFGPGPGPDPVADDLDQVWDSAFRC